MYYTKSDRELIPIGVTIKDIEDGDFWYEGTWLGKDEYLCTKVVLNGEEFNTPQEDDKVGTIQKAQWYYIVLK